MKTILLLLLATCCCFATTVPTDTTQTSPEALVKASAEFQALVRPLIPSTTVNGHRDPLGYRVDLLDKSAQMLHGYWLGSKWAQKRQGTEKVNEWLHDSIDLANTIKQGVQEISAELIRRNVVQTDKGSFEKAGLTLLTEVDKYLADLNAGRFP